MSNFKCALDQDIETFLHNKAIDFERRGWCSVYCIVDEDVFRNGELDVIAYFTLSHKTLSAQPIKSRSLIKKISGFKTSTFLNFILIGQLGKYIVKEKNVYRSVAITSTDILDMAFELINMANTLIPCRCVLVECKDIPRVRKIYEDYGFKFFQQDGNLCQYIKLL